MTLKSYVKAHAPKPLWSFLRNLYRVARIYVVTPPKKKILTEEQVQDIQARAQKYLPYYQDELSREILADLLKYFRTGDRNIFMDRTEKMGMKFHELSYDKPYTLNDITRITVLYDNEGSDFRYVQRALDSLEWAGKRRMMTLKAFLDGAEISDSELIVPVLTHSAEKKFCVRLMTRNIAAKIFGGLFYLIREDLQYFDVFSPVDDEVIIDAGAYDGTTALQFLEWGKGKVKYVYSFEFDPENAAKCEENLKPYADKITLIKKGTWDKDEVLHANASGGAGSSIRSEGSKSVYLTAIDNVVKDEHVTFIKMDVEGAELKSLMGARSTIINNHPRLAICVYHKPEDLYEIPGYILSLVPEYKFLLRHYCSREYETVLYAYCD